MKGKEKMLNYLAYQKVACFTCWKISIYDANDKSIEECEENWEIFGQYYALSQGIDIFDQWKGYLVENEKLARLVVRKSQGELKDYFFTAGEFDDVLKKVISYFEEYGFVHNKAR